MRSDQAIRRLKAWHAGKPIQAYETLHLPIAPDEDVLMLSFVRMGGESSPWGIACGKPGGTISAFSVAEARNRDAVADMVAQVAPTLLEHFWSPQHHNWDGWTSRDPLLPLRQVWLPNASHVDMLHHLAYTYSYAKTGDAKRAKVLNSLGRLAGWLFREYSRPGQVTVMVGTEALRGTYIFPAEEIRQAHLGYLLAWLETAGARDKRMSAAQAAERLSVSTSLDPLVERNLLAPLIDQWNDRTAASRARDHARDGIAQRLQDELARRTNLVSRSIEYLRRHGPRENVGVQKLAGESLQEHWLQYIRLEKKLDDQDDGPSFFPGPETDHNPAAAAARYFVQQHSEEFRNAVLIHDDRKLQEELLGSGEALRGRIERVVDVSPGKAILAEWTIEVDELAPLRVREGSGLCPVGQPKRELRVESISRRAPGKLEVVATVVGAKRAFTADDGAAVPGADDPTLKGTELLLLPRSMDQLPRQKGRKIWAKDGPGSWITHAAAEPRKPRGGHGTGSDEKSGGDNLFDKLLRR